MGKPTLRIFISSPGDVAEEREKARLVVEGLQRQFRSVILQPVLWEDLLLPATASFQETIDYLLTTQPIDIAVFILWSRLGSPLGPASKHRDGTPYRSGTEREFDLMLEAFEQSGRRSPIILAYARDDQQNFVKQLGDARGPKLKELMEQRELAESFIREHFQDEQGHNVRAYYSYREPISFAQRLQVHLHGAIKEHDAVRLTSVWPNAPYRGLEFFNIEHAEIFQGRDHETFELLQRLRDQAREGCAFVVILGTSGSGKSSLARAGAAANLIHHPYVDGIHEWKVGLFVPGLADGLLSHLVAILAEQIPELVITRDEQTALTTSLAQNARATTRISILPAFARTAARVGGSIRLLLIVDQMEELWTDVRFSASDREQFFDVLEVLANSGLIAIVATLRSDFYPHAQMVPAFLRLKGDRGQFDLLPPGPAALHQLITEPARLAGLEFETDQQTGRKLDEVIAEDAAHDPTALPLLEYVLSELYESRDEERQLLTFAAYERLGRVEGALGRKASERFQHLPASVKETLPELLSLLVTIDPAGEQAATRRWPSLAEMTSTPGRKALTDSLIAARFLTTNDALVSLAHEALLRQWKEVSEWIDNNRKLLQLRARVEQAEANWNQQQQNASLLLPSGLSLEAGRTLLESDSLSLSDETRQYILKSIKADDETTAGRRRLRKRVLTGLSCLALAAIAAAGLALIKWRESALLASDNSLLAQNMKKSADTANELAAEKASLAQKMEESADTANKLAAEKATLAQQMKEAADRATALAMEKTQLAAAEQAARMKANAETQKAQRLAIEKEELVVQERAARKDAEQTTRELQIEQAKVQREFARAEAERARAEAGRYQVQLARISYLGQDDPEQAMQLLQSSTDCPHDLRDFTWSLVFAEAINFPDKKDRVHELKQPSGVNAIVYGPQGRQLAVGHADGTITVWDTFEKKLLTTFRKHAGPVLSLAFSPNGDTLVSGGQDARVHVWDMARQNLLRTLNGHTEGVRAVDFSTDGTLILSGSGTSGKAAALEPDPLLPVPDNGDSGELILWSSQTGERDRRPLPRGGVYAARFQPHTHFIVIGRSGDTVRFDLNRAAIEEWPRPVEPDDLRGRFNAPVNAPVPFAVACLAFSSDGARFCAISHRLQTANEKHSLQQSRLKLHASAFSDRGNPEPPALPQIEFPLPDDAPAPAVAPPPDQDAVAPPPPLPPIAPFDPDVEAAPALPISPLASQTFGHSRRIFCAAYSPDGRTLVTGDSEGHLQLRDPLTGGIRLTLRVHQGAVQSVTFSPDGAALASASDGPSPKVVIHRILPTEARILADKIGWWSSAQDVMQAGYDEGRFFGTSNNIALTEVHLAESEAALAWTAGKKDLAIRKLALAIQHAERNAEIFVQRSEIGLDAPAELVAAVELLGRVRLAHHRATQAAKRPPARPIRVSSSRQPILWRITGGLPAGAASPKEQQILEELTKAAEAVFRRAHVRYQVGAGSATHAYESAARLDLAKASFSWAKGDSIAAVKFLQSAATFMEWASPIGPGRDDPQLMLSPASWNALSQSCDMQLALAKFKIADTGAELERGLDDVISQAEIELTGVPGKEELQIMHETVRSLDAIQRTTQLREEAGQLSPVDARLVGSQVLLMKSNRAWAAGQKPQAERFLADAVKQINEARRAGDAMLEAGHINGERIFTEIVEKQLEIQLAYDRIHRDGSDNKR